MLRVVTVIHRHCHVVLINIRVIIRSHQPVIYQLTEIGLDVFGVEDFKLGSDLLNDWNVGYEYTIVVLGLDVYGQLYVPFV